MLHIGLHHRQAKLGHHAAQLLHALLVGRDLRLQIGQVLRRVARRVGAAGQQLAHGLLAPLPGLDQAHIADLHPLLVDVAGKRRHRAGGQAPDVGMVPARAHIKRRGRVVRLQKHRRDDGHIGQVRAAVVGVVEHEHIARAHLAGVVLDHGADALAHRAQVHRHVRRVGDQVAVGVKQRAREIQPLLDVDRVRGVLQLQAHLLGDVHEQVVEHLQQHRVHRRASRVRMGPRLHPLEQQVVALGQARGPARLDHGGGIALGHNGRPVDAVARAQVLAQHQRGLVPVAVAVHAHRLAARHLARGVQGQERLLRGLAGQHQLDRHGLDEQAALAHQEGVALAIGLLEGLGDLGQRAHGHHQRGVGALVAHMHAAVQLHGLRVGIAQALALHLLAGRVRKLRQRLLHALERGLVEQALQRLLADQGLVGQAHAIGRQHPRQRMHQHAAHAQRIGHQAGVLTARTAKALQGVARHVVATRHRDFLDGIGHLLHRDAQRPFGHLLGSAAALLGQARKALAHGRIIEWRIALGPEHRREPTRLQLAQQHIGVGHRERTAAPVAGRAGVGPRALWPHPKARAVKAQDRAAAGGHRVDAHHGRAHAHAGHLGLELALELAGKVRHIGRGAAHVKADHPRLPGQGGGAGHADNAAGRPRQNRVLAGKGVRACEPARGLHEVQRHARHVLRHLLHIAAQNGREVGVDHRGVAPAHKLHQRAGLVAGADLLETQLARQLRGLQLVLRIAPTVHEDHRHAAQAAGMRRLQLRAQVRLVQGLHHLAVGGHALARLHHLLVQQLGQHDLPIKQARAVLVGNAQGIAKALRGHQQRGLALALEQRVGGHRGAHLHALHQRGRDGGVGRQAQQMPHAGHGRVAVLLGVVAQQLVRDQRAIGAAPDDVGEGAAAVNPELPAGGGGRGGVGLGHSDAAARAAWSYMPESTRKSRASSPMSRLSASSALRAAIRQFSRISR